MDAMQTVLLEKNKRYGDSALKPIRVFSKLDASEGILIRLDDKLSRIRNSGQWRTNDVCDMIGYLVLLSISKRFPTESESTKSGIEIAFEYLKADMYKPIQRKYLYAAIDTLFSDFELKDLFRLMFYLFLRLDEMEVAEQDILNLID